MVVFHRREPIRVPVEGIIHPRDAVLASAAHVPFLTQTIIADRIKSMAYHIAHDYHGKMLQLVPILKGAKPFADALLRELQHYPLPRLSVESVQLSSYAGTHSTGKYTLHSDVASLDSDAVLIVDGIVDTGGSAKFLLDHLHRRGAKEIGVCTLLHKRPTTKHLLPLQYVGFEIPDVWVVGFGMDYNQQYRELPYVAKLIEK